MTAGNMSLVDQMGAVQLAIQSAIRSSTSPEILNMFIKRENGSLRSRLASLESDHKLGRIPTDSYQSQAVEIIQMLDKLKEPLSASEQELLRKVSQRIPAIFQRIVIQPSYICSINTICKIMRMHQWKSVSNVFSSYFHNCYLFLSFSHPTGSKLVEEASKDIQKQNL